MNAFLSVSRGSGEPPIFLELTYKGKGLSDEKPLAIVGKSWYLFMTLQSNIFLIAHRSLTYVA